jgi:hypothetical protein
VLNSLWSPGAAQYPIEFRVAVSQNELNRFIDFRFGTKAYTHKRTAPDLHRLRQGDLQ